MEFFRKIRPARALLDWSLSDLKDRTGISEPNLSAIENGGQSPRPATVEKIKAALEAEGIEFLRNGVIMREDGIRILSGQDCYRQLLDDVMAAHCNELLIWCADDKVSPPEVNDKYRELRASGVKMRQLVQEGNTYLMGKLDEYRYLPKKHFVNIVKLTYGDKHATVNSNEDRIMIHRDAATAKSHREIFNVLWGLLEQPTKSTAHERF